MTPSIPAVVTEEKEEVVVLSPFVVESAEDTDRYQAVSTLAGTRVRTDLRDLASSISVVTLQFLQDTGSKNAQDLLVYTMSTEVGGVQGNYAGVGNMVFQEATDTNNLRNPGGNTRIRGLDSADNTRDYFPTEIGWDAYNVGRIDLQRGPNSILFGLGSPAGIINASVNRANFRTRGNIEARFGSFGSRRASLDWNQVLLKNRLAIRVDALDDRTKYRQRPAYSRDQRVFVTARWDPQLFRGESTHTSLRANYEHGRSKANLPRVLPPVDRITPFFDTQAINRQTWDGWYAMMAGIVGGQPAIAGERKNIWLTGDFGVGTGPLFVFGSPGATTPSDVRQGMPGGYWGLGANGTRDGIIGGFATYTPALPALRIANFAEVALESWRNNGDAFYPAADMGIWKRKVLTDPSIFDFYNQLLDGPGKKSSGGFDAGNLTLEQSWLNHLLDLELVYDRQKTASRNSIQYWEPAITVDVLQNLVAWPWTYADLVKPNPFAGCAYVTDAGDRTSGGFGGASFSDRRNFRATMFGEVRVHDWLGSSRLARILGRHLFTGLYARETLDRLERSWDGTAVDRGWADAIGGREPHTSAPIGIVTYLSGDLRSHTSAAGLNLSRITADQSPAGSYGIRYFDSHWNAPSSVRSDAAWLDRTSSDPEGSWSTESENPRNYVGWVEGQFNILNADQGDEHQLYTSAARRRFKTESEGFTWQGYLWDDAIVITAGWRRDRLTQRSGSSTGLDFTKGSDVANPNPELQPLDPRTGVAVGNTTTWGVVLHTPRKLRDKLPWGSDLSLTYNDGRNTRVENRFGFDGQPLPNARGHTRDFGVVMSALDDRLQLKATWYRTRVKDANLSSVTTEVSTLGYNTYYLKNLEAWGTASALMDLAGMAADPDFQGWESYWNWAWIAHRKDNTYRDPTQPAFLNDPATLAEKTAVASWLNQMQPQSWFDAYGYPIDVAKAKAGDYAHAVANGAWQPHNYVAIVQASGAQGVMGVWPTGTADNESKGIELELMGQPLPGWNVSVNASKTKASQVALGRTLVDFIEAQHAKFASPAGDLRLWWAGDQTLRQYYNYNIWGVYQFQQQCNGKMVPEMAPWRFNAVTNYVFQKGPMKGFNAGLGYRWEDGVVVGYALNAARDGLDVNRPYWAKSKDAVDLWVGYERKLNSKATWRIQLNVRSAGQNPHLEPITVEPDGSPATSRIAEGMTWQCTNSVAF